MPVYIPADDNSVDLFLPKTLEEQRLWSIQWI